MLTNFQTVDRPPSLSAAPAAIFAVLGLVDIALLGVIGSSVAPPLAVSIVVALLGLVTLLALVPARQGSRPSSLPLSPGLSPPSWP